MVSSNKKSFSKICEYYFYRFSSSNYKLNTQLDEGTEIIVVIPSMNEPALVKTLISLSECDEPDCKVGVIVVVNASEGATENINSQNEISVGEIVEFSNKNTVNWLTVDYLDVKNISEKDAGVGYARKTGMDEALRQFAKIDTNGVIVCLDADCTVQSNYLTSISRHYSDPKVKSACIYFEHDWSEEKDLVVIKGIINYELLLRYFVAGLKYAGFPHAHHTVGSCITVRADTYALCGGMNKRKAGEDFYFIDKLIPMGDPGAITNTCVYPSSRISGRVPFGTGKALLDWKSFKHEEQKGVFLSYDFNTFKDIKQTLLHLPKLYNCETTKEIDVALAALPKSSRDFFKANGFIEKVKELNRETGSPDKFLQRLLLWWSGLRMIKYVHYVRDHYYPLSDLTKNATGLLSVSNEEYTDQDDALRLLQKYRELEVRSAPLPATKKLK